MLFSGGTRKDQVPQVPNEYICDTMPFFCRYINRNALLGSPVVFVSKICCKIVQYLRYAEIC